MRSCDPVFVLFMTTGTYTRDSVWLAAKSGVVLKDVDELARLLADKGVQPTDPNNEMTASDLARWAKGVVTGEAAEPASAEAPSAA